MNDKYQQAYEQWMERIGAAETQLKNWRLACLLSIVMVIVMSFCLWAIVAHQETRVYIAEIKPGEHVTEVRSIRQSVTPTLAQQAAFIGQFVEDIMVLPLDPVVARKNWMEAYSFVSDSAEGQLTTYARNVDPFKYLGKQTQSVEIVRYHPVGDRSFEFTWTVRVYDGAGKIVNMRPYTGLFTVAQRTPPKNIAEIMRNPLGLNITYFSFSKEGEGS